MNNHVHPVFAQILNEHGPKSVAAHTLAAAVENADMHAIVAFRDRAAAADARLSQRFGYKTTPVSDWLNSLIRTGSATVGWRESCGKTDPTRFSQREWRKIVAALRRKGVVLTETNVPQKNSWATKAGGFWSEVVFVIGGVA